MSVIRFVSAIVRGIDMTVTVPDGMLKLTPQHDDIAKELGGALAPIVRNGIAKDGSCTVIPSDGGVNAKTPAQLQSLRSPKGQGDFTVYVDGVIFAYIALVDIGISPENCDFYDISWRGTINPASVT